MKQVSIYLAFTLVMLFFGCLKDRNGTEDDEGSKISIKGVVEKGPFVKGSTLHIYELDDKLNRTGRSFETQLLDDLGSFQLNNIEVNSKYIQLSLQNGKYFDELTGKVSTGAITLNAVVQVGQNNDVNVNVLSHLEEQRVKYLVNQKNMNMRDAKGQAQKELYKTFFINTEPTLPAESMSLTKDAANGAILLGISAAMLGGSESNSGKLIELLNRIATDLSEDGTVSEELSSFLEDTFENLNLAEIQANVKEKYKALGVEVPEFELEEAFDVEFKVVGEEPEDPRFQGLNDFELALENFLLTSAAGLGEYYLLEGLYTNVFPASNHPALAPFSDHGVISTNERIYNLFNQINRAINLGNTILDAAGRSKVAGAKIYRHKVLSHTAMLYWMLINLWGDPIYLHEDNYTSEAAIAGSIGRTPKEKVIADLLSKLESGQHEFDEANQMDASFSSLVMARLALTVGEFQRANTYLKPMLDGGRFRLAAKDEVHANNAESLFGTRTDVVMNGRPFFTFHFPFKGDHFHFARFTEVILLASEIQERQGNSEQALALFNSVRQRNGKPVLSSNSGDQISFIAEEYRGDMGGEGVYFAFLKRNNRAESTLKIDAWKTLLPFPQVMMDRNPNLVQNAGY